MRGRLGRGHGAIIVVRIGIGFCVGVRTCAEAGLQCVVVGVFVLGWAVEYRRRGVFPKEEYRADLGIEMECLGCCSYGKGVAGEGSVLGIGVPERNLGSHLLLVYFQLVAPFYQFGT